MSCTRSQKSENYFGCIKMIKDQSYDYSYYQVEYRIFQMFHFVLSI